MGIEDLIAEDADAAIPNSDAQAEVAELASRQVGLEDALAMLEKTQKELKEELRVLTEEVIPQSLAEHNLSGLPMLEGPIEKIVVEPFYRAHIAKARAGEAFTWLRENGHGDIVKNEVTASFGRGEDEDAADAIFALKQAGYEATQKESVHASTLKAFVREQIEGGEELPHDLLGVYHGQKSKIIRRK